MKMFHYKEKDKSDQSQSTRLFISQQTPWVCILSICRKQKIFLTSQIGKKWVVYRSTQLRRYLAPCILSLTEPNTPTIRATATEFLKVKRKKPHLSHWNVTVVSCLPWANCLTQLKIVPLNTMRVTALNMAELGYSKAGLLKNCQQCHAKKLWGDGTLFAAWKFRSASQSLGAQMSSPKSCSIVMYWHGDIWREQHV